MLRKLVIYIFITFNLLLTGCTHQNGISATTTLKNYSSSLIVQFNHGDILDSLGGLDAWVINESNYCFVFPYNYGVRIVMNTGGVWNEIPSLVYYLSQDDIILGSKAETVFNSYPIAIKPDISRVSITEKSKFIATIKGYLCDHPEIVVEKEIPFYALP
jgi:hypothetical protein